MGNTIRIMFEARARALHLPYTHLTSDADLIAQVIAQELADVEAVEEDVRQPSCFGYSWEGALNAECCATCVIQSACLHQFAHRTVPRADGELRTRDDARVGAYLDVQSRAVTLARLYARHLSGQPGGAPSAPAKRSPAPPPQNPRLPPPPSSSPTASVAPAAAAGARAAKPNATPAPPQAASSPPSRPTASPAPPTTPTTPAATASTPPATPASPTTTKAKRRRTTVADKMAAAMLRATALLSNAPPPKAPAPPPKAATTKAPKAKAPPKKRRSKVLPPDRPMSPKMSPDDPNYKPWGEHTYMARWLRERQVNQVLAQVRPGQILRREYRGETVEVRVGPGYYEYRGQRYATLYGIVKEVTGPRDYPKSPDAQGQRPKGRRQITNWSATRFFRSAVQQAVERC